MRQKSGPEKQPAEEAIKDFRRATRRHFSAEEKIRVVLGAARKALPNSVAARASPRRRTRLVKRVPGGRESDARFRNLCRRHGFGLLGVVPNGPS
jgi:hypothetical protein